MNKSQLTKYVQDFRKGLSKHSPEILQGLGIAGMITTTVLAVRATPKALQLLEEKKRKERKDELTAVETVKTAWKPYVPAAVTGVTATLCLIGSSRVSLRRNAALATAYQLSTTALNEYKEKVVETLGEKKEKAITDAIIKDKVEANPVSQREVIMTGKGNTLFYDVHSGRYFRHDIDKIRKVVNELNRRMTLGENYISLTEFYYELGLKPTKQSDDIGWNVFKGLIEPVFSAQMSDDEEPCLAIDYLVGPTYDYDNLH